ncbi:MAG: GNAT family N-acetyltransferase [Kofleriaceae bacterium]
MLALPDSPRWVEAHGIAADPASWRRELGAGFAVGSDRAKLIVVAGDVERVMVDALARELPEHSILVGEGLGGERAILHTLPDLDALLEHEGAMLLDKDAPLDHLAPTLVAELRATNERVWCAWVDERPVAFAYAPWRSERWFDISVDVEPSARQLGLGTIVATALILDERRHGREPVWGADEDNRASIALATKLGFVPVDELWVIEPRA